MIAVAAGAIVTLAASPDRVYDDMVAGPEVAFAVWDRFDNA